MLVRCLADESPERVAEVGLIEVAGLVNDLEDGCARAQEVGRVAGAFNLAVLAASHSGGVPEMALDGSSGKRLVVAQQDGFHRGSCAITPRLASRATNASAFSKFGSSQPEPSSQKDPSAATGTFTSRWSMRR